MKKISLVGAGQIGGTLAHLIGLKELVKRNVEKGRLKFTTNSEKGVKESDIIFICVGTPTKKNVIDKGRDKLWNVE